ncbi:MAG: DUF1924 domain-containing protein [Sulfurospirillum sp.]|nr:DUF1924 domain-containing protein [Sulfurospirillum sp.]
MKRVLIILPLCLASLQAGAFSPQVQGYIQELKAEVKKTDPSFSDFSIERGKEVFTSVHVGKKGEKISCTSCHNANLRDKGENVHTAKMIEPLSPSANPARLTKLKDVQKWLRRNFNDVYNNDGTALQRGDVLYYINAN